jgi:hypothetical protein
MQVSVCNIHCDTPYGLFIHAHAEPHIMQGMHALSVYHGEIPECPIHPSYALLQSSSVGSNAWVVQGLRGSVARPSRWHHFLISGCCTYGVGRRWLIVTGKVLLGATWSVQVSGWDCPTSRRPLASTCLSTSSTAHVASMMSPRPLWLVSSLCLRLGGSAVLRPDVGVSKCRPLASILSASPPRSSSAPPRYVAAVCRDSLFQYNIADSVVLRPGIGPMRGPTPSSTLSAID